MLKLKLLKYGKFGSKERVFSSFMFHRGMPVNEIETRLQERGLGKRTAKYEVVRLKIKHYFKACDHYCNEDCKPSGKVKSG